MTTQLPPITTIPSLTTDERAAILDTLFEKCAPLHTLSVSLLREKTFTSYDELIAAVGQQLMSLYDSNLESDDKWLVSILAAHPRLGEKKVESAQSRAEQAKMNAADGAAGAASEDIAERLANLNQVYEDKFPGLRYVVFVNGRSRPVIMEDMQRRIDTSNLQQEKKDAIMAMTDIASDRAKKLGG
ncbi:hypothetical protein, variant 2 [Exophiala mesophila]|uniref:Oxo-4-hydroxy-4-carboxy-5-ureidoimidazoline decarboxylase domain-containing protein n=1 Tax=Exophiala mesophila TaxID=212818 RepID=A0A0D2A1L8_EXOME|nr:hypothetical protein, variant 1 [Exophiala mesophila]XP_016224497.1 hypothetical protein, variant 2 [Exophiala mesophila]KIV92922.1 hypothetical protein, variant 1 [Exophiala mesophila]KIV92923.1 hypothetical protein, variant 2 [Exophiala mesophila]